MVIREPTSVAHEDTPLLRDPDDSSEIRPSSSERGDEEGPA